MISVPPAGVPITSNEGVMHAHFRLFVSQVGALAPLVGTGSPEGVVEAQQSRLYMDSTGATGSVLYVKRDTDIGGDTSKGWIAV